MIGVEQWRASIGLYHSGYHRQLDHVPGKRQLAPIPVYHLLVMNLLLLILAELLVFCFVTCINILVNCYSLLKWGLIHILVFNKRTSGTQLQVFMCTIRLVVMDSQSGSMERSVRAMAILLIIAGDVEENPGPLPPASASPESRALCHHSASLITAITDPLMLSWKLLSIGIIDIATKDKANLPIMTTTMKNDVLLSAVMSRVNTDPSLFHRFVDLLKDDGDDLLICLGRKLEDTFNEFTKGDTEQCTLNPLPPIKQAECSPLPPTKLAECSPILHMKQAEYSSLPSMKQVECSPTPHTKHSPTLPSTHSLAQSPFQFFISYLRSFYNCEVPLSYCKFPPVPKKKFINLAAINREKVSSTELKQFMLATLHGNVDQILETKVPIKVEALLDTESGKMLHCVLVEGAPGVGKTTLSWEICKRWAKGELFQQYTVVMLLRLRDQTVQNAKSIVDLANYMYDDDGEGFRMDFLQYMKTTKGKNILIILEGLDELPKHLLSTNPPSIFTCLLSRKILPDATIIVTSRPSATVQLRKGWEISRHIEVLGFTEKDITDYIQNAMSPQEFPVFDSYLSTFPNIRLTMYIPLNCAIVVEVYRSCQQSSHPPPKTITELYTRLVQIILMRYLDSHPDYHNDTTDVDKFTDLPPPVYQHFYKLIQMAYDGVINQQLIFQDEHEVKAVEQLGFMDTVTELFSTKRSVTYSYSFLHLSLQEYLAAYYVSLKSMDVQQQFLQTMCTEQHLRNMGRFLAGITKYQGMDRATVNAIIEDECEKDWDGSLNLSPYTLQLLHESGDYSIINGHPSYSCYLTDYSPLLDFAVLGHCIAESSYKWILTLGERQHMQSTNRIAMLVQTLKSYSNPRYSIEKIYCYYDAPECVQHLLLELPQYALQQIEVLWLQSNRDNRHPLQVWVYDYILSKMSKLQGLFLSYGAVSTSGTVAIADIMKSNNTLHKIGLRYNAIGAKGREALEKIKEIKKDLEIIIAE